MTRPLRTQLPQQVDTIGRRIRFARISSGLSQPSLARAIAQITKTKCSTSLVSKWELDQIGNPNNATMLALQAVTGFALTWLVSGKGPRRVELPTPRELEALRPELLARALEAAMPKLGLDYGHAAQVASKLYGILTDTPDIPPELLARFAMALQAD